ncbi:hypothetical protein TL16_g02168 [Triparma laevis f. inornata]|uniref:Uncharacterized protein n=2 Tax=Triparma laevis TaxID=1534972 RepID=A0A9W7FEL5_9STRA|nr:hypothetical protein TL16_g02168 [Triparma laevis f. inornata]GMI10725.1 hypothetical protein TrLO_g9027 [Triparma laevis f. longispina]
MKAVRNRKIASDDQKIKNKISSDFEKNLLTAHMAQKKTTSNVSLISLMCKATEAEVIKDYMNAVSWYKAALAFLKASDPNEIETAPIFRAHLGIGQNLRMLHRLDEAEKHFDMAVKLAKKAGDKKGLEEAAEKLGKTLIEHSEEMESQGLSQEAYLALQRGIMSLQEAVDGGVDNTFESINQINALSPSEKIMWEDEKVRKKGSINGNKKSKKKCSSLTLTKGSTTSADLSRDGVWRPGGKSSARAINVDLYASDMVSVGKVKKAPKYVSKRQLQAEYERQLLAASQEKKLEEQRKKQLDELYHSPSSKHLKTYEETMQEKNSLEEEKNLKKYAVRRGKHLFVKRGGFVEYMDGFTSSSSINNAATKIQSLWRSRKARKEVKKKKKEDSIELWSCNFECAGSPLVAVFCIVKEPMYLVKNEDYKEEDKLDYDVYVRPSQVLSKEEKIARLHRQAKQRFCLEMTIIQKGESKDQSEIVMKKLITQAELIFFVPKNVKFTRFEHLDLDDAYMQKHMRQWLPLIARRVKLKRGTVGIDESQVNRDLSLLYKLKFERTVFRSCGRVSWGPKWRSWWIGMMFQVELRLDESKCVVNCFSKNRRHPGIFEVKVTAAQMTKVLGFHLPIVWRELMEESEEDPEIKFRILLGKLRLVNTIEGAQIIITGEEHLYQLVQWPEERRKHRDENKAALSIEKVFRGHLGRKKAELRKIFIDVQYEAAKKRQMAALENKRRSSAAVTLQASIKRGFARKRAERTRRAREMEEDNRHRAQMERDWIDINATRITMIVRGMLARRRVVHLRLSLRADEMEKQGIYEADVIMEGSRVAITGTVKDRELMIGGIDDLAWRMEAKDPATGKRAKMVMGVEVVKKVLAKMEIERGEKEEEEESEKLEVVVEAKEEEEDEERTGEKTEEATLTEEKREFTFRDVFERCIKELTLFKSIERDIFILALKKKTEVKRMKRTSVINVEYN